MTDVNFNNIKDMVELLTAKRAKLQSALSKAERRQLFLEEGPLHRDEILVQFDEAVDAQAAEYASHLVKTVENAVISRGVTSRDDYRRINRKIFFFGDYQYPLQVMPQALAYFIGDTLKAAIRGHLAAMAWPEEVVPGAADLEKEKISIWEQIMSLRAELLDLEKSASEAGIDLSGGRGRSSGFPVRPPRPAVADKEQPPSGKPVKTAHAAVLTTEHGPGHLQARAGLGELSRAAGNPIVAETIRKVTTGTAGPSSST